MEKVKEQVEKRYERLNILILQRQELDQNYDRFSIWLEDKQRLIPMDQTIPLRTNEVERLIKKYTVKSFFQIKIKYKVSCFRMH